MITFPYLYKKKIIIIFFSGIYLEVQGYAKFHYNELNSETYYATEESYLSLKLPIVDKNSMIIFNWKKNNC